MDLKIARINNFKKILNYLLAFLMIINCNSMFITGVHSKLINQGSFVLLFLIGLILIYLEKNKNFSNNFLLTISLLTVYLLTYIFFQRNKSEIILGIEYVGMFILIFSLVYLVYRNQSVPLFLIAYCNIVCAIALISLFFWINGSILHIIQPNKIFLSRWELNTYVPKASYFNVYFETQNLNNTIRNSAIFVEAPMASLNFSISLAINVLYMPNTKLKKWKSCLLGLAILSTMSSTGYIFLILIIAYKMLTNKITVKLSLGIKGIIFVVIGAIGIIVINNIFQDKLATHSGISRSQDYISCFKVWLNYPILGSGINTSNLGLITNDGSRIGNFGYSNSLGHILGENGVYIFVLYIISIFQSLYIGIKNENKERIFLTILFVYLFATTVFVNSYIMLFMFSLFAVWQPVKS